MSLVAVASPQQLVKRARTTDDGIQLYIWPKLAIPKGWSQDVPSSYDSNHYILVPKGSTFNDAPFVILGKADYIPRMEKGVTLAQLIREDIASFKKKYPHGKVVEVDPLKTESGKSTRTFKFTYDPSKDFTHDKVAWLKEGKYYLVFTVTATNLAGFKKAVPLFDEVVAKFR